MAFESKKINYIKMKKTKEEQEELNEKIKVFLLYSFYFF